MKKTLIGAVALAAFLGAGCTRRIYIPESVIDVRTDTVYRSAWRVDSVAFVDSVTERSSGDTIIRTVVRERWRTRTLRDTLYRERCDTLQILKTITAPGEGRKLSDSLKRRLMLWLGGLALGAALSIWGLRRYMEHRS